MSFALDIPYHLAWPWRDTPDHQAPADIGRPCITTGEDVNRIVVQGLGDVLPVLSEWTDSTGRRWKRFELPSVAAESETGPATETLTAILESCRTGHRQVAIDLIGLPRLSHADVREKVDTPQDPWHEASAQAEGIVGRHISLINCLCDETQPYDLSDSWQGHAGGWVVRPLGAALQAWKESQDPDEPWMDLIVRLEQDQMFRRRLKDVCHRPRRILIRERQMQRIARIQEVDPACIRWLVRQPGISLAQKAGVRQEALGVVRVETADTLENRVVRDLVRRAIMACNRYSAENHRFLQHQRVVLVRKFRHELRSYLARTPLADVRALVGVPGPNYVLQHDARYRPLWPVYLNLVRQKKEQDEAWRWRHRIWAEHVTLGVMAGLQTGNAGIAPIHADLLIRHEQVHGKFLNPAGVPSSWRCSGEASAQAIDLVPGDAIAKYPGIPASLAAMGADLLLVRRMLFDRRPVAILLIWAVLDFETARDSLQARVASISEALQGATVPCTVRGLLVQPSLAPVACSQRTMATQGNATGIRMNLQDSMSSLTATVRDGLFTARGK